jgi:hypothetical protein
MDRPKGPPVEPARRPPRTQLHFLKIEFRFGVFCGSLGVNDRADDNGEERPGLQPPGK